VFLTTGLYKCTVSIIFSHVGVYTPDAENGEENAQKRSNRQSARKEYRVKVADICRRKNGVKISNDQNDNPVPTKFKH